MGKIVPTHIRTVLSVDGGVRFTTRHVDLDAGGSMGRMTKRMLGMITMRDAQFGANLRRILEDG